MESEILIDEIGYKAKLIEEEMTFFERMKIEKSTLKRMLIALFIYVSVMIILSITL